LAQAVSKASISAIKAQFGSVGSEVRQTSLVVGDLTHPPSLIAKQPSCAAHVFTSASKLI